MANLFQAHSAGLLPLPFGSDSRQNPSQDELAGAREAIRALVFQKDYPCTAAVKAVHDNDYWVGFYGGFGAAERGTGLRENLGKFIEWQGESGSVYSTFWAMFDPLTDEMTEEDFESKLWAELSALTSERERASDFAGHPGDPEQPGFMFSLFGEPIFVVGLFPNSSRRARRFGRPLLVFNVFRQFEKLQEQGRYDGLVKTVRRREISFQGSVNPMAAIHGEMWESIQFSGKNNPSNWKCPFKFLKETFSR